VADRGEAQVGGTQRLQVGSLKGKQEERDHRRRDSRPLT
jgi:hypothetical protein